MRPSVPCLTLAVVLSGAAVLAGAAASAQTSADHHLTAGGVALDLPAITALDCADMRAKLDEIDATGYRDGSPLPKSEADMALLDYENGLSGAYFERCVRSGARSAAPESVFVQGFTAAGDE